MKLNAVIRVLLTLVGLFALATQAQTTTLAVQRNEPKDSTPGKSPPDSTASDELPSKTAEKNDPAAVSTLEDINAIFAELQAQLVAQLSYFEAIVAAAQRLNPAQAAMREFMDDMTKSDYLASRMAELGVESAWKYWKAAYGGEAGDGSLLQWG